MCLWSLAAARPCLLVPPPLKRQSRSDFHHFPNPPPWSHLLPVNFVSTVNLTSYTHWVNWKNRTWKYSGKKRMARQFLFWKICIFSRVKEVGWHMNVKINIAEVSNPDPMYPGLRAQCESKKCYVVVELIVVVTTYKPLLIPTTISSFRSKTPLSKSTTQLEAVLKFVDSKCDFGLQIWRCNSFRCHLNPSHDGKLKPLFFQPLFTLDNFEFRKVQKEVFRFSPMLTVQHLCTERRKYFISQFFEF